MADAGTIVCENCQRPIAAANHTVHVSHCRRHLSVCAECGEPVPRDRLEEHHATEHRRIECRLCGLEVLSGQMDTHKEERCAGRAVICPYCDLSLPHSSLEEHEGYCGARTEPCPTCDVRVMYRHWPLHVQSGHKLTRPEPSPSAPPRAGVCRRGAASFADTLGDGGALDDKIASYVRKPVDEIVEDTMEQWRKRKDLRGFEEDCFEQAMLMAIEISKKTVTENQSSECQHCGRKFPADEIRRHQSACSWERQRRQDSQKAGSGSAGSAGAPHAASAPRWVARPVAPDQPTDDAITLPCEFCEQAFLDADLLRHQLRCEKNPQRLDLPASRAPLARSGELTRSHSASHADRQQELERVSRSSWRQPEKDTRASGKDRQQPETPSRSSWRDRLAADLDCSPVRRQTVAELPGTGWKDRLSADLPNLPTAGGDAAPRRWSLLATEEVPPPNTPQRKSKHKKKVNFLEEDEFIQPVPEQTAEVVDGDKKKKRSKEEKKQRKEEKKLKKHSSKKHRAPEPPGEPVIVCDF